MVVLGLPRGEVPVAAEVAEAMGAPLDFCLVRKLGVPFQPELGMGAIIEGGERVINDDVVRTAHITPDELAEIEAHQREVLESRARRFRSGREPIGLEGRTVLMIDDGAATGSTARAACRVAVPAGLHGSCSPSPWHFTTGPHGSARRPTNRYACPPRGTSAWWAAAEPHARITAVVSRGGRPDLAGPRRPSVTAPTLLICENRLVVVPGATHLFEKPAPWRRSSM
ncbi:hypothetical protein [Streptomyces sanglieri]|uniref:phosphoribosyltransferase n=1 Tax=Streptomyces sanglieri TaxID=193460 RepID=UPI003F94C47E